MESIKEMLEKSEKVKPIAELNGVKIVSFEDQVAMANADHVNNVGLDLPELNPDGSIAASPVKWAAVNEEIWTSNAYRVVDDEYQVVCGLKDYLTIKGMKDGRMPYPQVQADVFTVEKGKPKYKTTVTVSDTEFLETFTNKFTREDMMKILDALTKGAEREPATEKSIFK